MKKKKVESPSEIIVKGNPNGSGIVTASEFNKQLADILPAWVPEKEDTGSAMMQAGQELLLVIEDALIRYHKFSEEDLKKLRKEIEEVLTGVKEFERHGLSLLSPGDIGIVGDMREEGKLEQALAGLAETKFMKLHADRAGIEYPVLPGAVPFLKELKQRNKDK